MARGDHYSHMTMGGIKLTFGKRGIVFTRKPNAFNDCVGDEMRGGSYKDKAAVRTAFAKAAGTCGK